MGETRDLLHRTADLAADFLESFDTRPVLPDVDVDALRAALAVPLPDGPTDAAAVVEALARGADAGIAGMPSGRWFGFVIGGGVPASLAADWLTSAWDQNAFLFAPAPAAAIVEEIAGEWVRELLGLPEGASFGFVTGCQMANVTGLAAGREHVLHAAGWDLPRRGLFGAPPVRVVAGAKRHVTIDRALRFLGLGAPEAVAADDQGRMVPSALAEALTSHDGPTIVCAQLGEVNTGACDDLDAIAEASRAAGAWLHVDGAFGLWAGAAPSRRHLVRGVERADSWATDAHKWLNVPYDCGLVFCAHPSSHRAAISADAEYIARGPGAERDQIDWTPEASRRARGFAVYAALRSLGRSGVAALVEDACAYAQRVAAGLSAVPGVEIVNDVVLNQVLFRFETDERTQDALRRVQQSGEAWLGGTNWEGRAAIRVSVSNWQTTDRDIDRLVGAFRAAVGAPVPAA